MASEAAGTKTRKATNGAKPTPAATRDYVVVEKQDANLHVLATVSAHRQEEAMDIVAERLPPEQRNVVLAAFLANSYREQDVKTEQAWKTTKSTSRKADFSKSPAPPAA